MDRDIADATTSSATTLLSGQEALPIQLIEQSPGGVLDQVLAADLRAGYDADLESLLIKGAGGVPPFGEPLGLLNVPGVNSVTYTSTSPTGSGLYPQLGLAYAAVTNTRKAPIQAWLLRGGRFAWLATSEDASNRPLDVPGSAQSFIRDPTLPTPAGGLLNVPVFTDEVIPSTWPSAATGGNQDLIIGVRFSDFLLWESDRVITVDKESLSGVLGARFIYRGYAAAILGRQPSSIVTITGPGMAVQAGF